MRILVVIPVERHDSLLQACDPSRPEYAVIRNGIITHDGDRDAVEILCDLEQAEKLLDLARKIHPAAARSIEESIRVRRDL